MVRSLRWLPLAVSLCGAGGTLLLSNVLINRERVQLQTRTEAEAQHVAAQIQRGVLTRFETLPRLAAWWLTQGRPLEAEDWQTDAELFLSGPGGLKRVIWISPGGTQAWSVEPGSPPEAKERPAPQPLRDLARAASRQRGLSVSSAVRLDNGNSGAYACFPIRRHGKLQGFIVGLYDLSELLDFAVGKDLPSDYHVSVVADGLEVYRREVPSPVESAQAVRAAAVELPGASWAARTIVSAWAVADLRRMLTGFGILLSALLYVSTATARTSRKRAIALERANAALQSEILERKRMEDKFQRLIESDVIGVLIAGPDRILEANEYFLTMAGRTRADLTAPGLAWSEILPSEYEADNQRRAQELLSNGKFAPIEREILRPDGRRVPILIGGALLEASGDRTDWKCISFVLDLTSRRELELRLQRAEKLKSLALMAGGIAHDFNNLLTTILGSAGLAMEELPHGKARGLVGEAMDAANRAADLIRQILAYTGRAFHSLRPLDLSQVIREMREGLAAPPNVKIRYDLAEGLPCMRGDAAELRQTVRNLVSNAVEAIGSQQGTITISTDACRLSAGDAAYAEQELEPGVYVRLEVRDTGCGMPEEVAANVFDPFFTTKFMGRGLGLSAVHGVVRAHRGGIRVDSGVDQGTRFEIVFPAYEKTASASN